MILRSDRSSETGPISFDPDETKNKTRLDAAKEPAFSRVLF